MLLKSPDKHLTDQEFFSHIRFFNLICNHKEDDPDTFRLTDLAIGYEELGYTYTRIELAGKVMEISVDIDKDYKFDSEFGKAKTEAEKKPVKVKKSLLEVLSNIKTGAKIDLHDISAVSWIWVQIYEYIRFTPLEYKIPEKIKTIFLSEVNKYLDNLINDRLSIAKKNYFKFEAQKRILIKIIEEDNKLSQYGSNFIIKEKINNDAILERTPDFCIIQTVYALQKLGYLKVVDVWDELVYPRDSSFYKSATRYINVNLVLEDVFIAEINASYKKNNPSNVFEKFDAKRSVLKFAGKEIDLAKKGKETDSVLLLKTLLKAGDDDWRYNDEILEDWGYNDDEQKDLPKNKVYFAGQKINNAIALKTQIEDFVECNTTKARINPKYRKIDE